MGRWLKKVEAVHGSEETKLTKHISVGFVSELQAVIDEKTRSSVSTLRVACIDCIYFARDKIGDGEGIGKCNIGAWNPLMPSGCVNPWGPLYPNVKRACNRFEPLQIAEKV